jgi:lipoate-protein ligase A
MEPPPLHLRVLHSASHDPCVNLAAEEWLFQRLEPGQAVLFLCRNAPCVVIGRNQNPWRECDVDALPALGVQLVRRRSGGGAVFHDLGNLNYSFLLPRGRGDAEALLAVVREALAAFGLAVAATPRHGLEIAGRKIGGTAFWYSGRAHLQHGTLLLHSDLARLQQVLAARADGFGGASVASVPAPVANLAALAQAATVPAVGDALAAATARFCGDAPAPTPDIFPSPGVQALPVFRDLVAAHAGADWVFGRTPPFTRRRLLPPPAGAVELAVREGRIEALSSPDASVPEAVLVALATRLRGVRYGRAPVAAALAAAAAPDAAATGMAASWIVRHGPALAAALDTAASGIA